MFAGLPGIGVGTLFYVLTALWMPFRELIAVVRRQSCVARWQLVASQFCFAISIVASVGVADRVLALLLGGQKITSVSPARLINESFAAQAPASLWAAPIVASLLLLAGVMAVVEVLRLWVCFRARRSDRQGYAGTGQPTAMILQGDKR